MRGPSRKRQRDNRICGGERQRRTTVGKIESNTIGDDESRDRCGCCD